MPEHPDLPQVDPTPHDVARLIAAWRTIAHSETGRPTVTMSRTTLRQLFDGMDGVRLALVADVERLRAQEAGRG